MKCPRCVQRIHATAVQCPHCGFVVELLDVEYESSEVRLTRLSDTAGALKRVERRELKTEFDVFERAFPQLFVAVHLVALEPTVDIRQYAFWLLNRGVFEDVPVSKSNEGGLMIVIDVSGKAATLTHGYLLDAYVSEEVSFELLTKAHPHLLQGQYFRALQVIIRNLMKLLRKSSLPRVQKTGPSKKIEEELPKALERVREQKEKSDPMPENPTVETEGER